MQRRGGTRISSLNGIKSGHFSSIYIRTHCTGGHKLAFLVVVIMDDPVDEPERRFGTYHFPGAFGTSQFTSSPLNSSLLLSNDGDVNDPSFQERETTIGLCTACIIIGYC